LAQYPGISVAGEGHRDDADAEANAGLEGGDGDDVIRGGNGDDHMFGDRGRDRLFGGRGRDSITGETHNYVGPPPGELLVGGPGGDCFRAQDGYKYRIYCGAGIDRVYADNATKTGPNDTGVRDFVDDSCERVDRH
jgi:Ca2+-binding RTX toxin-like protein